MILGQSRHKRYLKKGVSTLDISHRVGLKYCLMINKKDPKVEGSAKSKVRCFQKPTSTRKSTLKAPASGLEDKALDSGKKNMQRSLWRTDRRYPSPFQ